MEKGIKGRIIAKSEEMRLLLKLAYRVAQVDSPVLLEGDKREVDLCQVADDPFVLYKPKTSLHDVIDKVCNDAGFHTSMSFEAFDERIVAGLVGAKLGVSLSPFIPGLDMQKVPLIHVHKPDCLIGIQIVYRTNEYTSPALKYFISYVENAICLKTLK